jgi:hypothetical protein
MGIPAGTAALAREVHDELTDLGINQLAASARVIEQWSNATGPDRVDTTDACHVRFASVTRALVSRNKNSSSLFVDGVQLGE